MTAASAPVNLEHLRTWIGREEAVDDLLTPRLSASLRATLDCDSHFPRRAAAMPVTMHWCLTPPVVPMSRIDVDGHPMRGGFLPPVPLPRRMWASSESRFSDTLRDHDTVTRHSRIADVTLKSGRSGPLVFVTVDHRYETPRGLAVEERQSIVYREAEASPKEASPSTGPDLASGPRAEEAATGSGTPRLTLFAGETLLQRYSALTFNAHRIHYDRPYAVDVEGYPGLVLHGPLQAALLAEFAADLRGGDAPTRFAFRGSVPLFDRQTFTLQATPRDDGFDLTITDAGGRVTMTAEAGW